MTIFQYPALQDNYNWIIVCPETKNCAGVDIYDVEPFFEYINKNNLTLTAILNTHHHQDHTGGNKAVAEKYPDIKFYGSAYDFNNKRIDCQTHGLSENDKVSIGNIELSVLEIPGHTLGHISYYNDDFAFVGDTLFASGCGRLFEGTPEQMFNSFDKLVKHFNETMEIYCGHEYTLSNLNFASSLNNDYFSTYKAEIENKRKDNIMTVPTDLKKELNFNPFLMVRNEELKNDVLNLSDLSPQEAFTLLRKKKDNF